MLGNLLGWLGGPSARRALDSRLPGFAAQVQSELEGAAARAAQLNATIAALQNRQELQAIAFAERCARLEAASARFEALAHGVPTAADLISNIESVQRAVSELREVVLVRPHQDSVAPGGKTGSPAMDYAAFQRRFRGPAELIQAQLAEYVPFFRGAGEVVDLGCGRGEFLEACRAQGLSARGVDDDPDQIAQAQGAGLRAEQAEILAWIRDQPDASCDGLFSAHVIEHLPFELLPVVLHEVRRVLRPNALAIFETVNPHNPAAFRLFYLDPTHVRPLFPEVLEFLAVGAGFEDPQIHYPNRAPAGRDPYHGCGEFALVLRRSG